MFEDLTKAIEIIEQQYKVGIDYSKGADTTALCMVVGKQAEAVIKALSEYLELTKAKAEGRLVVLPCKVGDSIYRPEGLKYSVFWTITNVTIYPDEIVFTDDSDNIFTLDDIGKTVFLTREEAEKALEVGK